MTDSEMQLSDDEDYDLEYDSNSESEPDVDLENQYYHAKSASQWDPHFGATKSSRKKSSRPNDAQAESLKFDPRAKRRNVPSSF